MLSTTLQYIGQLYNMTLLRHLAEMQVPEAYTLNNNKAPVMKYVETRLKARDRPVEVKGMAYKSC